MSHGILEIFAPDDNELSGRLELGPFPLDEQKTDTEFTLTFPSPRVYQPRVANRVVKKRSRRKRRKPERKHEVDDDAFINAVGRAILDADGPMEDTAFDEPIQIRDLFPLSSMESINFLQIYDGMSPPLYYNSQGDIAVHGWGGLP